ncbi:DUF72 domain-containing protein [Methylomagnum sp.]
MSILIGTASWTDQSLIDSKLFYPPEAKTPEDRLRFYAERFPLVEVDSSYYALPSEKNAARWAERTPPAFVFNVKSFRLFTQHQTPPNALPADIRAALGPAAMKRNVYYKDVPDDLREALWARFLGAIRPLREAGKLGVVLFQFPPWFVYGRDGFEHIERCVEIMAGCRVAVEFRHHSWLDEKHRSEVLEFERKHDLAHVVVDEPQGFGNSIPAVWEATSSEVAVVRLHGRNAATWNIKGAASSAERFNYIYSRDELGEMADPIRALADAAAQVHVVFNNNMGNYAQRNAAELMEILE